MSETVQPMSEVKKPMSKLKKRIIIAVVALALLVVAIVTTLIVTSIINNRPPELEKVRDRYRLLIEASLEYNDLLWGEGLPTHPRIEKNTQYVTFIRPNSKTVTIPYHTFPHEIYGTVLAYHYYLNEAKEDGSGYQLIDLEAEAKGAAGYIITGGTPEEYYRYARVVSEKEGEDYIYHNSETGSYYYALPDFGAADEPFYYTSEHDEDYDLVREDCGYLSTTQILDELADIYSAEMFSAIEESLFVGVTLSETSVSYPRYRDLEDDQGNYSLGKLNDAKGLWRAFTIHDWDFDYSTMEIVKPSSAKSVTVTVAYDYAAGTRGENDPDITQPMKIRFALGNDGNWYLDSYTW